MNFKEVTFSLNIEKYKLVFPRICMVESTKMNSDSLMKSSYKYYIKSVGCIVLGKI